MVSPSELLLLARKGSLEVSMDDDVKTVPEGASFRMLILPPDALWERGCGGGAPGLTISFIRGTQPVHFYPDLKPRRLPDGWNC